MLCTSVKKKGSKEQCTCQALPGYMLCGRHAKCKQITFWVDVFKPQLKSLIRFQAIIRGKLLRKRLALSGPGVLCRKNLANEEDLDTCTEAHREHPDTYFSFEENGKIYWFHFATIWKLCLSKLVPINPYTRTPISSDTLKRLHALWGYRYKHKLELPKESLVFSQRLEGRWNILCQIFNVNGFGIVHLDHCMRYNKRDYVAMLHMMRNDLSLLFCEQDRKFCSKIIQDCIRMRYVSYPTPHFILNCVYGMMIMLLCARDQYALSFNVLSAMYRC